jgi:hypothetical protein
VKVLLIASLAFALALAGCSTASVSGQGGRFSATGTSASGGSAGVNIQGGTAAGVVVGVATIAALIGAWRDSPGQLADPEMLEGRSIIEVDCTQPIADWSKNLKCK